jgi:Terminase small subunit
MAGRFDRSSGPRPLSDRAIQFAKQYVVDRNGVHAAKRAGYTGTTKVLGITATKLLADTRVRNLVGAYDRKTAEKHEISQDWVIARLLDQAELASEKEDVTSAMKAYELIGKHIGMFPNNSNVTLNMPERIERIERKIIDARPEALSHQPRLVSQLLTDQVKQKTGTGDA